MHVHQVGQYSYARYIYRINTNMYT
jgi:hypothetical protein